jgi:2-(1,2-epoxy-1,2-dihydrophenyl)acetyl-CoA isomerase
MSDFEYIEFDRQGAIATITLNRPQAANGLNTQLVSEFRQAAHLCDGDPELKVVILRATGDRFFCVGGDIKEMLAHGDAVGDALRSLADDLHAAIATLLRMKPVLIVAVNGVAGGAGLSLALIGDLVLAAESASFTMAYTRAGLSPDGGSTWLLPRLVGLRRAQELMLTNPTLDAAEAREFGIVTRVVPDDDLHAECERLAAEFAAGAGLANAYVRKLLLAGAGNDLETQLDLEAQLIAQCAASPDGREGIQAFVDKRQPRFR